MVHKLRTMSFMELIIFQEVVRCGGITAASNKLGIAKSAVSTQLSRLEKRLGVKLLERSSRRLMMTVEGQQLLPRVESLIAEGEFLFEYAETQSKEPGGQVRIALTPDFGQIVVAKFFPQVTKLYPQITLGCKFSYQFEDMQDTAFDLGVRIGKVNDESLVAYKLGQFKRVLVAGKKYAQQHPTFLPKDLKKLNCMTFSSSNNPRAWSLISCEDGVTEVSLDVCGDIAVQSFNILVELCLSNQGVAYIPYFLVKEYINSGQLKHILPQWQSKVSNAYLVYRFGADKIHRIKAVIDCAKTYLPSLLY
ncbi:LysR family transcriptional regulator [Spartinivicinus ruber]|uniref:LysR family transcriptional regulator n=1 Tax=Spartinivicinus ruber TaxID=2683272 RepID=UPI0013D3ACB4|nr:LysR family transcriptional regulator [Spartinivicinus ruber]